VEIQWKMDDLSDLERLRLDNIRRNAEFLSSLGLGPAGPGARSGQSAKSGAKSATGSGNRVAAVHGDSSSATHEEEQIIAESKAAKRRKSESKANAVTSGVRSSKRVRRQNPEYGELDDPEAVFATPEPASSSGKINDGSEDGFAYDNFPEESRELDDYEFEIFALLRKWRLDKARAEGTETYKIFQNRTLCEAIRRRRNDPDWARLTSLSGEPSSDSSDPAFSINSDVFDCWGIGPSKGKPGGVAEEMLQLMEAENIKALLNKSRGLSITEIE
jgi:hypothetical protein